MTAPQHRRVLSKVFPERVSAVFEIPLLDHLNQPINPAGITTLTLTLYDQASGSAINARNDSDILNVNGGTLGADGVVTLELEPADMALANADTPGGEVHVALLEWTFGVGGVREGAIELVFTVANLAKRP